MEKRQHQLPPPMAVEMAQKYVSELERIAEARQKRIAEHAQELREVRKAIAKALAEIRKLVLGVGSNIGAFNDKDNAAQGSIRLMNLCAELGELRLQRIHLEVELCFAREHEKEFPANLEAAQARLREAQAALDALNGDSEANS